MRILTILVGCVLSVSFCAGAAEPIRHRLLLSGESRHELYYVDEVDASKCWTLPMDKSYRDMQLIGGGKLLVSHGTGYRVFDLATRKCEKEFKDPKLNGTTSVRRCTDGRTIVAANQKGIAVFELDKDDKIVRQMSFPELKTLRLMRLAADGNVLLAEEAGASEVAFDSAAPNGGKIVRRVKLPASRNAYMALKKPDGNYLVSGGYGQTFYEQKPDGSVVRKLQAEMPKPLKNVFYAGFQVLKNGNIVVVNWTGHGPADGKNGWQVIEFDKEGQVVWKYHNPEGAGSIHGVIVLDELDTQRLNEDSSGLLGAGR